MHGTRVLLKACFLVGLIAGGAAWLDVVSTAARAQAQDVGQPAAGPSHPDQPPSAYEAAADLGFQEFERGNYAEARARFLEAHELWPNARSLRALGHCEYELRDYVTAVDLLRQALASSVRPLRGEPRMETEKLLEQARAYVARYKFEVKPSDARISIDGIDTALNPLGEVMLKVGPHRLEVQAEGYQPRRRELQVEGNADRVIRLELLPTAPEASAREHDEPLRKKWWVWTGAAAFVAAGVATGLAVALHDPSPARPSGGNSGIVINVQKPMAGAP